MTRTQYRHDPPTRRAAANWPGLMISAFSIASTPQPSRQTCHVESSVLFHVSSRAAVLSVRVTLSTTQVMKRVGSVGSCSSRCSLGEGKEGEEEGKEEEE